MPRELVLRQARNVLVSLSDSSIVRRWDPPSIIHSVLRLATGFWSFSPPQWRRHKHTLIGIPATAVATRQSISPFPLQNQSEKLNDGRNRDRSQRRLTYKLC